MVSETWKSIREHLAERTNNPFLASYAMAFVAYNWKAVLVVAYADKESGLALIEQIRCVTDYPNNFLHPAYFAAVFSLLYPPASVIPYFVWEYFGVQKTKIKRKLSLEKPISLAESIRIKEENIRLRETIEEKSREFRERVIALEAENTKLYETNHELAKKAGEATRKEGISLDAMHQKVLKMHAGIPRNTGIDPGLIKERLKLPIERVRLILENLEKADLVKFVRQNDEDEHVFELTEGGRRYLADNNEL